MQTCQVVGWHISAHMIYSSNPDPWHHTRVWPRFRWISNSNFCHVPHVTCTDFSCAQMTPCVTFMSLGQPSHILFAPMRLPSTCKHIIHAVQSHFSE